MAMASQINMDKDLPTPQIVFCGFQRIGSVPRLQQQDNEAALIAAQVITISICLATPDAYTFAVEIHKQADIQTLARTIEATLIDRRIVVACLADKGSNNILRWSDTVDDVLDTASIVEVIPLFEVDILHTMELFSSKPPILRRTSSRQSTASIEKRSVPNSAPLPQLEFMQLAQISRANSTRDTTSPNADTYDSTYSPTTYRRPSDRNLQRKAISRSPRVVRPTGVRRPSDIAPNSPSVYSITPPPLPTSPIPQAILSPLAKICSNAISLLAFCKFCVQKKTLCELLFWLDTTSGFVDEEFVFRVYLSPDAPLRLNVPREITTITEARELLRTGILSWVQKRFYESAENLHVKQVANEDKALYESATITFTKEPPIERRNFVALLSKALHPEDTSILSLKERKTLNSRQAILEQVYSQYFPSKQFDASKYFEYRTEQLTRPERLRLANRKTIYGGLFDKHPSSTNSQVSLSGVRQESVAISERQLSIRSTSMSEHIEKMSSLAPSSTLPSVGKVDTQPILNSTGGLFDTGLLANDELHNNFRRALTPSSSTTSHRHKRSASLGSSIVSDDTQNTPVLSSNESQRADLLRRQTKLKSLLGDSPKEVISSQTNLLTSDVIGNPKFKANSPTPSVTSHISATSSRFSLIRAEKDEENERRTQARRAAKLYAMFGEHTDSALHVPTYRGDFERSRASMDSQHARPRSSASQYSPAFSRAPSRAGSVSAQSLYSPMSKSSSQPSNLGTPDSRYRPARDSGRKSIKNSFGMFKHSKPAPLKPDLLADFPTPPSSISFNHSPRGFNRHISQYTSSLYQDDESIMEVDSDEEDDEGDAIVQDVRTNMKVRQLLGNDAPTSTIT